MTWENFGDVSVDHGQIWINSEGGDDYAECVEIVSGADIQLADNQYLIRKGSVYFSQGEWDSALSCCGRDIIGPPEFLEIAYAMQAYMGFDDDTYGGWRIVQVGRKVDDWTASGTTCDDPDLILHGNASIERYLEREYLV